MPAGFQPVRRNRVISDHGRIRTNISSTDCTDDFAGHFAHNANLSAKAILGIASYGYLASMLGETQTARKYTDKARKLAGRWMEMADDMETFHALVSPMWNFANGTTDRIPMSDWVYTDKPQHRGFRARSVGGGYWIKLLEAEYKR